MLLCQRIDRQLRLLIGQGKADNDVLAAKLTPEAFRRPFLRLGAARSFDPDEVPLRHEKRPGKKSETWKFAKLRPVGNVKAMLFELDDFDGEAFDIIQLLLNALCQTTHAVVALIEVPFNNNEASVCFLSNDVSELPH